MEIFPFYITALFFDVLNKIFLNDKQSIIMIYKILLMLDKINLNYNDCFDKDNIIEVNNFSLLNNAFLFNRKYFEIEMKEPKDIIIRSSLVLNNEIYNSIQIKINGRICNLLLEKDYIYHKVNRINLTLNNSNNNLNKNNFVINIIPLKNTKAFNLYKNNKDNKIISLIQKSLIHYLIFLFEDINREFEKNINKIQKEIFQKKLFKFISIPLDEPLKNNNLESTSLNDISNQLIKKLNESIGNTNDVIALNDNLVDEFKKINKEMRQKKFDFLKYYDYQIKIINKRSSQKKDDYKLIDEKKYDKLFKFFNYDLSNNKNIFSNQIKLSEELNLFINKIFLFGVKYYNCYEKLNKLKRQIEEQIKIENEQDIKANINLVKKFENYSLFYSFYKASYKIKEIYHKHKSKFKTSNFDKENKQYFEVNFQKLEFFYNNIIPCDDITMQPNITIINEVQDILDNPDIGINEIKKFLQLQTMNSQIKLIKLSLINNLLLYLNNEENIIFLLNLICKKMRNTNIQLNLFDNMFGANSNIIN